MRPRVIYAASLIVVTGLTLAWGGGSSTPTKEEVPKYLKMLKSSQNSKERALAAEMLGKRGAINATDVKDAVDPLKKALQKDSDAKVRAAAAQALGNIAPEAEDTVPLLIDALKEKSFDVKLAAITALSQYGSMAKSAIQPLSEIAKDKTDKKLSISALIAIKAIRGPKK